MREVQSGDPARAVVAGPRFTIRAVERLVGAITLAGTVEGLVLATKAGLDAALFLEVARVSSGASALLDRLGPALLGGDAPRVPSLASWRRELTQALRLARRCAAPTPLAGVVDGLLMSASRELAGQPMPAGLVACYERLAGCRPRRATANHTQGLRPPAAGGPIVAGFVGLGRIGKPMAESMRRAGLPLVVYNRSQGAVDDLVRLGAERATSPADVVQRADVVLTCLPDNEAVERVYLGPQGLVPAADAAKVLVDVGTTALSLTRKLDDAARTRGAVFVDAPISGGIPAAREGKLTIMVGATEAGFRLASPALAAIGERLFHVGMPGAGQVAKVVNNMLLGTSTAAVAEGLVLGVAAGLPAQGLLDALLASPAASWAMRMRGPMMVQRTFQPFFTVSGRLKDSQAALALGQELHVPLPLAAVAHELYQAAAAAGLGGQDFAAVVKAYESLCGWAIAT